MPKNTLLQYAKNAILIEAQAVADLANNLDENFTKSCELIQACKGKVILMGMGKSGHIGNKIAATLASTGTPAFSIHPSEAGHGDLGMITNDDIIIVISYSGESEEIITLLPILRHLKVPIISMTSSKNSSIAKTSDVHLNVGVKKEACPHNITPTSSTMVALAMGDALAISLFTAKGFSLKNFARSHPSGTLGKRLLTTIKDIMKKGDDLPQVNGDTKLLDAITIMSQKALGMIIITAKKNLLGVFTDGDLRRTLENHNNIQNLLIKEVMITNCKYIYSHKPAIAAVQMMDEFKINSLPVVNNKNEVIGAINTHTLMQAKII